MAERVVVAMSGGVDSSVAAALLLQQGYEVIGVTLDVWPRPSDAIERQDACCSLAAVEDARRVADHLGFPHYVLNFRQVFAQSVIADFVSEYRRGRTPNPCIRCNEHVKFGALLRRAQELGARFVATGHYARLGREKGRFLIRRAADAAKDQTYVLYSLTQHQLAHALFPLGEYTKPQTRALARELGLAVAERPESQEICFVADNDYGAFLAQWAPEAPRPGPIVDRQGRVVGRHRGIVHYTVGQRRRLGVASARPLYVISVDPASQTVTVGEESELYRDRLLAEGVNLVALERLEEPLAVTAKVRYRSPEVEAVVLPREEDQVEVRFHQPQRAIAPGQAVVFYQGDLLIGGGTILAAC